MLHNIITLIGVFNKKFLNVGINFILKYFEI